MPLNKKLIKNSISINNIIKSIVCVFFVGLLSELSAAELQVIVLEKGTGLPIKRAEVQIGQKLIQTGPDGVAKIELETSTAKLAISRMRFQTRLVNWSESKDGLSLKIYLLPGAPTDNEVYIRGVKRPTVSKKSVSKQEAVRVAPNGDPVQVTRLLPGVQSAAFRPEIIVRGSAPGDSLYLVDSFKMVSLFHTIGSISVIPEQMIEDVEFSAGGFGAEYGEATGGVINLVTRSDIPERAKTEFKLNLPLYSSIYHERPLSESSGLFVSYRRSYLEAILPLFLKGEDAPTISPYFTDAHLMYVKKTEAGNRLKVFGFGSGDGIKLVVPLSQSTGESGKSAISFYNYQGSLGVEHKAFLGSQWTLTTAPQLLFGRARSKIFDDYFKFDFYEPRFHVEAQKSYGKNTNLYIGMESEVSIFSTDLRLPQFSNDPLFDFEEAPRVSVKRTYRSWTQAAWLAGDIPIGPLVFSPGIRGFFSKAIKKSGLDPRLNIRWPFFEGQELRAALGQFSKTPDPAETSEEFGNPDLKFMKSKHYILGLASRWTETFESDLQIYQKKTEYLPTGAGGAKKYLSTASLASRGVELFLRRNLTQRWFGWLAYSYSINRERNSDEGKLRPAKNDQTHIISVAGSYRVTSSWEVGTRIKYNTGDTYTPVRDAVYNSNLDKYQPRLGIDDTNSGRLPNYQQVDLFAKNDFLMNSWKLEFGYGLLYYTPKPNTYARTNNYDYSREQDIQNVPVIPYIELKGTL